jgi:type IV pilus assembly protein PilV
MNNLLGLAGSKFMGSFAFYFRYPVNSQRSQKGAGFVEVLVALFILAIGLLGVLSMQSTGLGSNQRAMFTSEVSLLAADMADRIKSFGVEGAVAAGEYNGLVSNAAFVGDPTIVADQAAWAAAFTASTLPSGDGQVVWNAVQGTYTIFIRWDDERTGVVGRFCPMRPRDAQGLLIDLTCYQLTVRP